MRNAVLSRVSAQNLVTKPQFLSNTRPPPSRAWLLSGSFPCQIHQESKSLLKSQTVSDQAVAEALCAIMLLEDSSPRQALADFLLARKLAIQQLLNQPHHGQCNRAASFLKLG